ncbi:MAG: hypothetical protein AAF632_03660 [Bacteroidota bacterium]
MKKLVAPRRFLQKNQQAFPAVVGTIATSINASYAASATLLATESGADRFEQFLNYMNGNDSNLKGTLSSLQRESYAKISRD